MGNTRSLFSGSMIFTWDQVCHDMTDTFVIEVIGVEGVFLEECMDLYLNVVKIKYDPEFKLSIGRVGYDEEVYQDLKTRLAGTHLVQRHARIIETISTSEGERAHGETSFVEAGVVPQLIANLLREWLVSHFSGVGRGRIYKKKNGLTLISTRSDDDLLSQLPSNIEIPKGVELRPAFDLEPRVFCLSQTSEVCLAINARTKIQLKLPVGWLVEQGMPVKGLWATKLVQGKDERFCTDIRLVGLIERVEGGILSFSEHRDGKSSSMSASEAFLEPRIENLAKILHFFSRNASESYILQKLRNIAGEEAVGAMRFERVERLAGYLVDKVGQTRFAVHLPVSFSRLLCVEPRTTSFESFDKPHLIFGPGGREKHRWNQGGLDRYGPFDQHQFNPKKLNVAVICQEALQGRVETCIEQFLYGVPDSKAGKRGFIRRFSLDKPYLRVFSVPGDSARAYKNGAVEALEHIADRGENWNLVLVQIDESMEQLEGSDNPYLVTKTFFLSKGVAVQHIQFETIRQPKERLAYSLNNMGLACYAKLGGIPWLLPEDHKVAHELVIGLGSYHQKESRFGVGNRFVGITTVFSGDGQYLLENRTHAVSFDEYESAMLDCVRGAVENVRTRFSWTESDPVRLIFHAFKPVKNKEVKAVECLMQELNLPHAEYAFVHVAEFHPFCLFDLEQEGTLVGANLYKGKYAPPRGGFLKLSAREALLCLKGSRELKQATDGHPSPLQLRLHRNSSFRDLTYLAQQIFSFSCHSWQSFLPAPTPITILYSQLIARNLGLLRHVPEWSESMLAGKIGRTRWFL